MHSMSERLNKQATIFHDMVVMFSLLIKKGVITNEEIIEEHKSIQAQLDILKGCDQVSDVQSEDTGTDEDNS